MQGNEYPQRIERSVRIKRVDPLSFAKFQAVLMAIFGVIAGAFMALMSVVGASIGGARSGIMGLIFGVGAIIILPIFYGVIGFIAGLITSFVYNFAAGIIGGVELTVE